MNTRTAMYLAVLFALFCIQSSIIFANPLAPSWALVDSTAPARSHFKCVYDTSLSSIILFGGMDSTGQLPNDLWKWDQSNWSTLDFTGPSGRKDFGMCYDKAHDNIVLYGGQDAYGNYLGDTWILSDNGWALSNVMGPSPRAGFSMTYDDLTQNIILFGGTDGQTCFGETWRFNGVDWAQITDEGPSARIWASSCYDPDHGACILYGGMNCQQDSVFNDTWIWDGFQWTMTNDNFALPRMGQMMAYCSNDSYFQGATLFGGVDIAQPDSFYNDTWMYDFWYWQWNWVTYSDKPPARIHGELVNDEYLNLILLIGGTDGVQTFHDVWKFPVFQGSYIPGDINGNGQVNGIDVVYFVNYLKGGPPPARDMGIPVGLCPEPSPFYAAADVNGNCMANGIDVTFFVRYLKLQVPSLLSCPDCPPGF